jgi:hypothetical protein
MTISLTKFRGRGGYLYDLETKTWTESDTIAHDAPTWNLSGTADIRFVGIKKRESVFVAVFTDGATVFLTFGNLTFDLSQPGIRIVRRTVVPFLKRFEVWQGEQGVAACLYWWTDLHEWPDDEDLDIFLNTAVRSDKPGGWRRFIAYHALRRSGKGFRETIEAIEHISG